MDALRQPARPGPESLCACCWSVASLDRASLAGLENEVKARHPGAMLLTSCQRLEAYGPAPCDCPAPLKLCGERALLHLAEVAAGLHSVVLGEAEVLGQVRAAVAAAPGEVQRWAEHAIAAARELRRETPFDSHAGHLLDRALRLTRTDASGRLLVAGTGRMGRLVAQRGVALGFSGVVVAGRTRPDGPWFREGGFDFVHLDRMPDSPRVAVAAGCLGSSAPELDPAHDLPPVDALLADFGTPRNFGAPNGTPLVTIADLLAGDESRRHGDQRRSELGPRLAALLSRRLEMARRNSATALGALRLAVEDARQEELTRARRLHPEVASDTLDALTRALVNRIFDRPSRRLRELDDPEIERALIELLTPDAAPEDGAQGD